MKKLFTLFFVFVLSAASASAIKVGVIDLCFALSLHPRMALFDFERLGFYKVGFGLSKEAYTDKVKALKENPASKALHTELARLEEIIEKKSLKREQISDRLYKAPISKAESEKLNSELALIAQEAAELRSKMLEIEYQINNPDLTSIAETHEILKLIEDETASAIRETADKLNLEVVLNTSTPYLTGYPTSYRIGSRSGQGGVPGIDTSLFYSFLGRLDGVRETNDLPSSYNAAAWLSLTHYPLTMKVLPLQPWPLVLKGGQNILPDVLKIIYKQYKASEEVINIVCALAQSKAKSFVGKNQPNHR